MFPSETHREYASPIRKLYIEPSSKCNLNCAMCFRNNWCNETQGIMTDETFYAIYSAIQSAPPQCIVFGGMGEPLLHPRVHEWTRALHEIGCRVEIITNATLLTPETCEKLVDAGIHCVWISMEAFSRDAYQRVRRGAVYDVLIRNIQSYNAARGDRKKHLLGITFVMLQENMTELVKFNAFSDAYAVDLINLSHAIPVQPIDREETIYRDGYPVGTMERWLPNFKKPEENHCRFIAEDNTFVRWDGDVAPCMQLLHECYTYLYREKRYIRRFRLGNVNEESLLAIWNSDRYVQFRDRVRIFDFPDCTLCDGCEDRQTNETDCIYNTFPTCGACLWGQGIAYCP